MRPELFEIVHSPEILECMSVSVPDTGDAAATAKQALFFEN
jgi:hypothetical protein